MNSSVRVGVLAALAGLVIMYGGGLLLQLLDPPTIVMLVPFVLGLGVFAGGVKLVIRHVWK